MHLPEERNQKQVSEPALCLCCQCFLARVLCQLLHVFCVLLFAAARARVGFQTLQKWKISICEGIQKIRYCWEGIAIFECSLFVQSHGGPLPHPVSNLFHPISHENKIRTAVNFDSSHGPLLSYKTSERLPSSTSSQAQRRNRKQTPLNKRIKFSNRR